jgi:type III pantothenate kinase
MKLFVDVGNSHVKWARCEDGAWKPGSTLPTRQEDLRAALMEAWSELPSAEQVVVCSVAGDAPYTAVASASQALWQLPVKRFVATAECAGVRNRYEDPAALGGDRWAALIGARRQYDGAQCVVDCGTAVTVDALDGDGVFLGGVILPGLALLRSALASGTAGAKELSGSEGDCLARSTADGVAAGTRFGLAGAVERLVAEHRRKLGAGMRVVLTGGNSASLVPLLDLDTTFIPDLVLRGLAAAEGVC